MDTVSVARGYKGEMRGLGYRSHGIMTGVLQVPQSLSLVNIVAFSLLHSPPVCDINLLL